LAVLIAAAAIIVAVVAPLSVRVYMRLT